jgi:hypothetical protein
VNPPHGLGGHATRPLRDADAFQGLRKQEQDHCRRSPPAICCQYPASTAVPKLVGAFAHGWAENRLSYLGQLLSRRLFSQSIEMKALPGIASARHRCKLMRCCQNLCAASSSEYEREHNPKSNIQHRGKANSPGQPAHWTHSINSVRHRSRRCRSCVSRQPIHRRSEAVVVLS